MYFLIIFRLVAYGPLRGDCGRLDGQDLQAHLQYVQSFGASRESRSSTDTSCGDSSSLPQPVELPRAVRLPGTLIF